MEIADSARRHEVSDEDMLHAVRNAFRAVDQGDDLTLFIGPDFAARPLEVVVLDDDPAEEPVIIHAMPLRENWAREL